MVVISSKTERSCDEKYEKIVQVCMNWIICSIHTFCKLPLRNSGHFCSMQKLTFLVSRARTILETSADHSAFLHT